MFTENNHYTSVWEETRGSRIKVMVGEMKETTNRQKQALIRGLPHHLRKQNKLRRKTVGNDKQQVDFPLSSTQELNTKAVPILETTVLQRAGMWELYS